MGGAADAGDTDLLAAQIFEPLDRRLGQNALRENIFLPAYADEFGVSLDISADNPQPTVHQQLSITTEHRRRRQWRRAYKDQSKLDIVFPKEAGLLGNPRHRL